MNRKSRALPPSPFRRFISSPEVIRLVVMMYVRFPLSLRNVEDLLFERGIDISYVHNHFNIERHLVSRNVYKDRRSAALTEWQMLIA